MSEPGMPLPPGVETCDRCGVAVEGPWTLDLAHAERVLFVLLCDRCARATRKCAEWALTVGTASVVGIREPRRRPPGATLSSAKPRTGRTPPRLPDSTRR